MSAVIKEALLSFRPMHESDLPIVLEIEESAYAYPWSMTIFQDCLKMGYSTWVLERDARIIAYAVMSVAVGECHLLNLCVRPAYQHMGHGEMMLDYMLDLARKHQAEMAFLEVRPSNAVARRLYHNKGFNEVGLRRNYYPAHFGREDAVIMALSLV
jgi:ribosomal-protein-alanine N-acetyltransferase